MSFFLKTLLLGLGSFFLIFAHSLAQNKDDCLTLSELRAKDSIEFIGYGTGANEKDAAQNAQVDLASRIRQNISSSSTVTSTNTTLSFNSQSQSNVDENLVGVKIAKRCKRDDQSFSAVATLRKDLFLNSLAEKIKGPLETAKNLAKSIQNAPNDTQKTILLGKAKKFLEETVPTLQDNLQLCKVFQGCADLSSSALEELKNLVSSQADKNQYALIINERDLAMDFKDDLTQILKDAGYDLLPEGTPETSRKILASCTKKPGAMLPNTKMKVVETTCSLQGFVGSQQLFFDRYACKAMSDGNESDNTGAANSCLGRLKKVR